ncbi:MAG: (d)CMP kinase [Bdellovibrionales bacterium]|nr:(d)CMP kinase [Bdellovibrionales bacterium]
MTNRAGDRTVVTVDGPSASGKTSVSRELAKAMSWEWVSTGAFYRGLACVAQKENIDLEDRAALAKLATNPIWSVQMTEPETLVVYKGQIVNAELNSESVALIASKISQYSEVRKALLQAQRNCSKPGKTLVAEGRDCGSVVFPEAVVKIYLTATLDSRVMRRSIEHSESFDQLKTLQEKRDQSDAGRKHAPMQIPPSAHVIDSSQMTLPEVVSFIKEIIEKTFQDEGLTL